MMKLLDIRLHYQPKSVADDANTNADDKEEAMSSFMSISTAAGAPSSSSSTSSAASSASASASSHTSRTLVRQSTDLTSSFPLKPFQRIASETVEVPGLNVKVMRYRISNDLGKIEPHLYINYNIGGGDSGTVVTRGKLYFSLRYSTDIQSLMVTIKK